MKTSENLCNRIRTPLETQDVRCATAWKFDTQIEGTKQSIRDEFRPKFTTLEHLLNLALNEAEALAWESGFPHLVFATLANEKAQALALWQARQESLRRSGWELHFAA